MSATVPCVRKSFSMPPTFFGQEEIGIMVTMVTRELGVRWREWRHDRVIQPGSVDMELLAMSCSEGVGAEKVGQRDTKS